MSITDRSLWLLQHFNINISEEVWKAIKLSDGMFDKGNEDLLRRSTDSKNVLHYIIHFADWTSTVAEKQHYLQSLDVDDEDDTVEVDNENLSEIKDAFDSLFGTN